MFARQTEPSVDPSGDVARIDYYFSPMSGDAYLGHATLMALAQERALPVRFLPVDETRLDLLPEHQRPDRIAEQARRARRAGLRMAAEPLNWPTDPRLACRAILAAGLLGLDQAAASLACLRGVWAEQRNIADPGDLAEAFDAAGLPGCRLIAAAGSEDLRDAAQAVISSAQAAGIPLLPCCAVAGRLVPGLDGLDRLRQHQHQPSHAA
ncbi:DsbA family protein [Salipiger marinus]|uniref:DsbA family protein n=1 Tax=Salipiger marinus TaxID=555512 RepID=UPI001E3282F4|nr:DsbA family protein [Salipiger manganoxidans]MCD1616703.1 DsbA family protein [Salipiger manganoxidans]MEB3420742.1 DsbA family protein [Salipiger manganoxidans]